MRTFQLQRRLIKHNKKHQENKASLPFISTLQDCNGELISGALLQSQWIPAKFWETACPIPLVRSSHTKRSLVLDSLLFTVESISGLQLTTYESIDFFQIGLDCRLKCAPRSPVKNFFPFVAKSGLYAHHNHHVSFMYLRQALYNT